MAKQFKLNAEKRGPSSKIHLKSLRKNKDIHQTKMMMDVILNSGIDLNENNKSDFTFTNAFTIKKDNL